MSIREALALYDNGGCLLGVNRITLDVRKRKES